MGINWIGLYTMVRREVSRMARVPIQAFVAPWISALLFIFIFGFVVGGRISTIGGHRYLEFVLPGILMMNIVNAATALGYGANWLTGWFAFDRDVLDGLGLKPDEKLAGFIHVGTPTKPNEDRPRPVLSEIVSRF